MKKIIFVVDDDPDVTLSVKQALEYYYPTMYVVTCVEGGKKCLELLQAKQIPDMILLDIMMPGMSGWMLSDRLKENPSWKNIPVVFLTIRTDELAKKASSSVCEDYIEKPFDIEDLKKRIDKILKKSKSESL